ncbi:MAG: precorrin-2 dehydrogenase [Clostridia bacterium]|nr:precorrin-2 dehydrogenase [Clostridia bacterium]
MGFYHLSIDLTDCMCLVVGGGSVGERKIMSLLDANARVTLVSPVATRVLSDLALARKIVWLRREYKNSDIEGKTLVFAATGNSNLNVRIAEACKKKGIWVNVADDPEKCTFMVPSVVKRGDLQIAISTGGKSPALARYLREQIEAELGPDYSLWVEFLGNIRSFIKSACPYDQKRREEVLRRLVGDEILFRLVVRGKEDLAKERVKQCLSLPSV